MKTEERDLMLGRIDAKTTSIEKAQIETNKHLAQINGRLNKHDDSITALNTTTYGKKSDKGLCGEVSTLKKLIFMIAIIVLGSSTVTGLEWANVINLFN
jgi:hypothetical protein